MSFGKRKHSEMPKLGVIAVLLIATIVLVQISRSSAEAPAGRMPLVDFPLSIGGWKGVSGSLEVGITDFLELSDYVIADFRRGEEIVNLYIAYYDTLSEGAFPHSPKLCIPGGGWEIENISQIKIGDDDLRRVLINRNNNRQIVYYWYQQGDRFIPDEYQLKWNTFVRAFRSGRSDTSLVRLVIRLDERQDEAAADAWLAEFFDEVRPVIMERLG